MKTMATMRMTMMTVMATKEDDDDDEAVRPTGLTAERAREAAGPTGLIAVPKILPRAAAGAPRLIVLTSALITRLRVLPTGSRSCGAAWRASRGTGSRCGEVRAHPCDAARGDDDDDVCADDDDAVDDDHDEAYLAMPQRFAYGDGGG